MNRAQLGAALRALRVASGKEAKAVARSALMSPSKLSKIENAKLAASATDVPRFASEAERDTAHVARLVNSAAERLAWGGDVSLGFYLEHPSYLSLALVTCSPNRAAPELACPFRQTSSSGVRAPT